MSRLANNAERAPRAERAYRAEFDEAVRDGRCIHVAGVDEAGRGPLAGPVVAAAVILPAGLCLPEVNDSKRLTPAVRARLSAVIREQALAWNLGMAEPGEMTR